VLITGSADGLGHEAAKQLVRGGHEVVLHARDEARARQALAAVPGAAAALPGDLSSITSTRALAGLINAAGAETQVWLASSNDPLALESGRHFYHRRPRETHPAVADPVVQDGLLAVCDELTGQAITDTRGRAHAG
jgi:NAD(P)-dependent dehydrogenase (short-subunit alcohol dehydrogenase family)